LWLLVLLSVMAMGLSQQIGVEIQLTRYALAKTQSKAAALSGLAYAKAQIALAGPSGNSKEGETLYRCGFVLDEEQTPQDLFEDIEVGNNRFSVYYTLDRGLDSQERVFGFSDEESRLNLNGIGPQNYKILSHLLVLMGQDQETADQISVSVVDWRDADNLALDPAYGAEDDYYLSLERPYPCKNGPFESIDEFLAVRGVTPDILTQLRPFLTIIPTEGASVTVNPSTASREVLLASARFSSKNASAEFSDADSLVEKILLYRRGDDDRVATHDDRPARLISMPLNSKENLIALLMQQQTLTQSSQYFRARIKGQEPQTGVATVIEAVIDRKNLSILSWNRR